jgi:hypothetical protein
MFHMYMLYMGSCWARERAAVAIVITRSAVRRGMELVFMVING